MSDSSSIALSAAVGQARQLEVIANNLANVNTNGFKADRLIFSQVLNNQISDMLVPSMSSDLRNGETVDYQSPTAPVQQYTDFSPGQMVKTGRPMDLAINGEGFFEVQTPNGIRYTRQGNFRLGSGGEIETQQGHKVMGSGGPVNVSGTGDVLVAPDGSISVGETVVGQIKVVAFENSQALNKVGETLWSAEGQSTKTVDQPEISQGYLEGSNVNAVDELVRMIATSRSYEAAMKVLQTNGEMNTLANQAVGRTS